MGKFNFYAGDEINRSSFIIESGIITLKDLLIKCHGMPIDSSIWCHRPGDVSMHGIMSWPIWCIDGKKFINMLAVQDPGIHPDRKDWLTLGKMRSIFDLVEEREREILVNLRGRIYNRYKVEIWSLKESRWSDRPQGSIKFSLESTI